jgi:hypothetical protein
MSRFFNDLKPKI